MCRGWVLTQAGCCQRSDVKARFAWCLCTAGLRQTRSMTKHARQMQAVAKLQQQQRDKQEVVAAAQAWAAEVPAEVLAEPTALAKLLRPLAEARPAVADHVRTVLAEQAIAAIAATRAVAERAANEMQPKRRGARAVERLDRIIQAELWEVLRPLQLPPEGTPLDASHAPAVPTEEQAMLTAVLFREHFHKHKPVLVCAVCACFCSLADIAQHKVPLHDVPNRALLDASGLRDEAGGLPRTALTTVCFDDVHYCVSPGGVVGVWNPSGGMPLLRVCAECWAALGRGVVPPRSLVRVDTGPWPSDDVGPLPHLTMVEEALVSPVTVLRRVMVMRPEGRRHLPSNMVKKALTGHVIVLPGPAPGQLARLLPLTCRDLAENLLVGDWLTV